VATEKKEKTLYGKYRHLLFHSLISGLPDFDPYLYDYLCVHIVLFFKNTHIECHISSTVDEDSLIFLEN
jgi:hypothetical protein